MFGQTRPSKWYSKNTCFFLPIFSFSLLRVSKCGSKKKRIFRLSIPWTFWIFRIYATLLPFEKFDLVSLWKGCVKITVRRIVPWGDLAHIIHLILLVYIQVKRYSTSVSLIWNTGVMENSRKRSKLIKGKDSTNSGLMHYESSLRNSEKGTELAFGYSPYWIQF